MSLARTTARKHEPITGPWTEEQIESLARHFRLKPGLRMLDAGSRDGLVVRTWGRHCLPDGMLATLAPDDRTGRRVARLVRGDRLNKAHTTEVGILTKLPFKDRSFDVSIAYLQLSCLPRPELALAELIRVTRRKGCVAVFDQAQVVFGGVGFANHIDWSPEARFAIFGLGYRIVLGRRKVGQGDLMVGLRIPGWLHARGFQRVESRVAERVGWLAPPYRSAPAGREVAAIRKALRTKQGEAEFMKQLAEYARAGGATTAMLKRLREIRAGNNRRLLRLANAGQVVRAGIPHFVCTWGFKP